MSTLSACTAPQTLGLREFEAVLQSEHSATAALTRWCRLRGIANPPAIIAQRDLLEELPPPPAILALLQPTPDEQIAYRRVRLICGDAVLSNAQNWYVPARLTAEMNHTLATSDTPFGRVIAPLGFTRELLESKHGPKPASPDTPSCPEDTVLIQRALLRLHDGRPVSAVVECYTSRNLIAP
jgi:hypothetical protein